MYKRISEAYLEPCQTGLRWNNFAKCEMLQPDWYSKPCRKSQIHIPNIYERYTRSTFRTLPYTRWNVFVKIVNSFLTKFKKNKRSV